MSNGPSNSELWVNVPHRCAKDDEITELRECLRLAWEFAESALGYDACDDNPDVEHRGLAKANLARIRRALGEETAA